MTTPYQSSPDGAIVVGGGEYKYSQAVNEAAVRSMFEMENPTPANMVDLLRMSLERLPIEGLQPFANFLGAVDNIFDNIGDAVNSIVTSLTARVFQTVEDFNTFLNTLFTNPGSLINNLFGVVMDGINTIGDFLKKLWENFTGIFTTPGTTTKSVTDVATAGGTIKTTLGTTTSTAEGARDNLQIAWNELYDGFDGTTTPVGTARTAAQVRGRGASVRASSKIGEGYYLAGANILINPGFDDPAFAILNSGVAVTADVATGDVVRSGTRSLKLVASASAPYSMLAANTTSQVHLPCSVGETYYLEAWVYGKATNTQATAAGGIIMGLQVYTAAKVYITNVSVNFTAGTALNSGWTKISGKITIPAPTPVGPPEGPRAVFFTPYVQLNTTVTAGHTYYFDDVVVREVTDAAVADAKVVATNTALYGTATPAAAIVATAVPPLNANKITAGTFGSGFIADGAILDTKIATNAVTTAKIAADAVDNSKIAANAVTAAEIATGAVGATQLGSGAVTTVKIATNAVTANEIAADAVGSTQIADGAVTAAAVTDGALTQAKVAGLPGDLLPVSQTLIDHSTAILDLKADREVTVNQGRTMSISFTQLANANDLPTTGTQTWSTQYLTGSGPTFGITSGKAAWKSSGTRSAKVLYRGAPGRTLISTGTGGSFTLTFGATTTGAIAYNATQATVQTALGANAVVTGTNALTGLTITPVSTFSGALSINSAAVTGGTATLSDGIDSTLTDYQSLRGALVDPPGIFGNESSGFTALARVSQDGNSYVFARAYWQAGLNLKGKIGYVNNGVETVWQDLIPLTWSTELTFRLGVDDNPRAYQVFSGTTLVVRYDEGYTNYGAFPAGVTGRTYVDNTGNRLTVTGTAGTFTLTVLDVATTGAIAFNATAATVATALNAALNTAYLTTGITYATVTGTAANTAGTNGGLVVTFNTKVKGQTPGNTNMSVNPAGLTGGTATVANRYTWSSGTGFVPSAATTGVGAASALGVGNRRFGAEVRTVGSNNSGTISSVAVTDNPPVVYAGSVGRMSRLNTTNVQTINTTDTALQNNFFDDVDFESLDIDANLAEGSFTSSKSKMYIVQARIQLSTYLNANGYLNLQVWNGSSWVLSQKGGSLWGADTGSFALNPGSGFVLAATWLQYLNAGQKVRLSMQVDTGSRPTALTGGTAITYFTISALQ